MYQEELYLDETMKLTNQLCFSVYNVSRLFTKFYEQVLSDFGLTYSQYLVLVSLWEQDNQTLYNIGQSLNLKSNTLTPLLKRLETAGWIERKKIESDKRQLLIKLTDKGKSQQHDIYQAISQCVSEQMNLQEYQEAKDIMDKLELSLKNIVS
ncbi:MarR family transcriptional regulator [Staphylococcus succinus]|jgi:DNA-binding MarR family transcriptional regulator|uniref:HTH-type transcriptional regulator SarZ n=2 Tax=Staphylococcus succinus TaxID=61015 RepID=A0A9Q6MW96_9STAP|nr:MarR family transcriptional regulator [Staphylococcus succinus]MEB8127489.1 MarR family transcriptional regulator [Staphylococcus succinus]MEB8210327.1 MarR family transcriptional regulator [Staphylococcus succinus]PTI44292.1 MarR family transcriptional regulator [Staphylococcus succinus]PTI77683.1 MarR family transcriptional regulator [Staphylococcus succinus]PTJ16601.1 MarR family transcriptional regulator [Staphylococcus succinus]